MDGVVADVMRGASEFHKLPCPYRVGGHRGELVYDPCPLVGMDSETFWGPLDQDFWAGLPKTEEADRIVDLALRTFGKDGVCFLTSPTKYQGCADGKRAWAERHYPEIPVLLSCRSRAGAPPKWFCASPESLLIDDYAGNCREFQRFGGRVWLAPRPWNDRHSDEPRLLDLLREFLLDF
jgi:hypothetical protein